MDSASAAPRVPAISTDCLCRTFELKTGSMRRPQLLHAVQEVSLTVPQGASVGIVGESGSGKSTTARMITGLLAPSSGHISIYGQRRPNTLSSRQRVQYARTMQMVFQDPYTSLDPRQSIRAAIDEVQRVHFSRTRAEVRERTDHLLESTGLGAREAEARPRDLSGGQRQRAAIARALAAEPKILLLDEAVSALDVSVQAQILNLLADLREELDLTYVLISHDLAVVKFLCESIVVMKGGRVIETGESEQVLTNPAADYTQRLLNAVPRSPYTQLSTLS